MKKFIKVTSLSIALFFFLAGVISAQEGGHSHKEGKAMHSEKTVDVKSIDKNKDGKVYQCPMDKDQISDKAGDCPKCGMKMKEVSVESFESKHSGGMEMKGMENKMMMDKGKSMDHGNMMQKSKSSEKHIVHTGAIDVSQIDKNKDGKVYQDMMDWNVISDSPGDCPLCGMKMKEVTVDQAVKNLKKHGFETK
ncbi:MAG: hypothetical protein GXO87_05780 [Chlorobi bacterium]|nr:hypothetical protein [Chlorobiota bacterium]